uniref:LRRCT domain-containing protein n=1 Tax=Branchiostoma floridae TaxID=7739 RepID=C3XWN9_BRAFL|eukprot:XP_002611139.1 hypothetical protein BRAFLDRAFT_88462 [Branchiostoma floridae]
MGIKLRHLLMFIIIILKELNVQVDGWWVSTPEADCSCAPSSRCDCTDRGLTSIPQNLPTSIYELNLKLNQITIIQKGTFANLPQLQELDLSSNQITMIQAGSFVNLPQLQDLQLYLNKITIIQAGTFVNLPQLQELELSYNQISVIQAGAIANLSRLQDLDLSENQILIIQAGTFTNLPGLQELDLSNNQISMIQAGAIANLSQLQELHLFQNNISMIQAGSFENLPHLQELELSYNQISVIQAGAIANLPQLQKLHLFQNNISMIQADAFANLPKLHCLDLRNNKLSAIGTVAYDLLPANLDIKLDGNPWQCDCKMVPFRLDSTEFPSSKDQITCAQPANLRGQKLTDVSPEELVCTEPTIPALPVHVTLTSNGFNVTTASPAGSKNTLTQTIAPPLQTTSDHPESKVFYNNPQVISKNYDMFNNDTTKCLAGKRGKTRVTISSSLQTISHRLKSGSSKESVPSFPILVLIGSVCGSMAGIALIGIVILTIWHKRRTENRASEPSTCPNSSVVLSNMNMTGTVVTNGHYYQTGPGHGNQYEDIDQHNHLGQDQSHTTTECNTKTKDTVVTSDHDPQYEDVDKVHVQTGREQSQSNINTKVVEMSDHDPLTGQDHPHAIMETRNPSYGTRQIDPMQNSMYKVSGQSQTITKSNINATVIVKASAHDHSTGQGRSQVKNPSYGTGQIDPIQSSMYQDVGQSHDFTESNPNSTTYLETSCRDHLYKDMSQHNDTDLDQSQAFIEARNPSYGRLCQPKVPSTKS